MSVITQLMNLPGAFEPTVGVGLRVEGYIKRTLSLIVADRQLLIQSGF